MKYEITNIEMNWNGHILHRIKALKDFTLINGKEIHKGDLGGWIENENNLSQEGLCWIYEECKMYENARRSGNSIGYGNSQQFGNSQQYDCSRQFGHSCQSGYSKQFGYSQQFGHSKQLDNAKSYSTMRESGFSINRSVDDVFTFRSPTSGNLVTIIKNDMNICTGCFSGSIFWMINPDREKLPKDHWAFSLHKQILEGKFKDIEL